MAVFTCRVLLAEDVRVDGSWRSGYAAVGRLRCHRACRSAQVHLRGAQYAYMVQTKQHGRTY